MMHLSMTLSKSSADVDVISIKNLTFFPGSIAIHFGNCSVFEVTLERSEGSVGPRLRRYFQPFKSSDQLAASIECL